MIRLSALAVCVAVLVALAACASATPEGETVALYRYRPTADFLATKDRVQARCRLLKEEVMGEEGGVGTRQEVRNYAASIGADTVLWWEYSESPFKGGSRAQFYQCRQAAEPAEPTAAAVSAPVASPTPLSAEALNLPGQWRFQAEAGEQPIVGTLRFWFEGSHLYGTYTGLRGNTTTLTNLTVTGNLIAFDLVVARGMWHLDGALEGSAMSGTFRTTTRTIRWTAMKIGEGPSARSPSPNPR